MKFFPRPLATLTLVLTLLAIPSVVATAQTVPVFQIPSYVVIYRPDLVVNVPVDYTANGNAINSTVFSIDFDETCLGFDPTDSDGDDIPDSVVFTVPPAFRNISVTYDATVTDGELGFLIADTTLPFGTLPSSTLVTIQFSAICQPPPGGVRIATLAFANHPALSCGSTSGQSVPCIGIGGTVTLGVQLASFEAQTMVDHVQLSWETINELNNLGFNLYRSESAAGPETRLNAELIPSQAPGSNTGYTYQWQDFLVVEGRSYWYWLEDVNVNGGTALHGPVSITFQSPTAVELTQLTAHHGASRSLLLPLKPLIEWLVDIFK